MPPVKVLLPARVSGPWPVRTNPLPLSESGPLSVMAALLFGMDHADTTPTSATGMASVCAKVELLLTPPLMLTVPLPLLFRTNELVALVSKVSEEIM